MARAHSAEATREAEAPQRAPVAVVDLDNLDACVDDVRRAALDGDPGPPDVTDFATLRGQLESARARLPPRYQESFVAPFVAALDRLGPNDFAQVLLRDPQRLGAARLMLDMAKAVTEKGERYLERQTDAFEEIVSDLYDGFLSASDRHGIAKPTRATLAPVVKWGNPDDGPYTWTIDATRTFGADAGVVNLPPANARQGILAWAALAHETVGHDVLHAYEGLLDEVATRLRRNLTDGLSGLASYWSKRVDETASDVMGILNMGPAAAIGLIGYFRGLNQAFTGVAKLRSDGPASDPHPADALRGFLAAEVVKRLRFAGAAAWYAALRAEAEKDARSKLVLAGREVDVETARRSAEVVAETLVSNTWDALQGHALAEVQNWADDDEEITRALLPVVQTAVALPDVPTDTFYAAHVVAAAVMAAHCRAADVGGVMARMLVALTTLHDRDPSWGPLYVVHRGDLVRDLAYVPVRRRADAVEAALEASRRRRRAVS